jgi:hypothetical protein
MKVFLAFSFRPEDKEVVDWVDRLMATQEIRPVTGEGLGGEQLTPAVEARIDECDALVALLTRREAIANGGYTTHSWVRDELGYARAGRRKPAIALIESGVSNDGMQQPHEHIPFDRANPVPALIRLSETLRTWKREMGRTIKVQVLPPKLAAAIPRGNGVRCRYRKWLLGRPTPWVEVTPVPELGGTFVHVEGVQEEHLIELEVEHQGKTWYSPATSQWMQITLEEGGAR